LEKNSKETKKNGGEGERRLEFRPYFLKRHLTIDRSARTGDEHQVGKGGRTGRKKKKGLEGVRNGGDREGPYYKGKRLFCLGKTRIRCSI